MLATHVCSSIFPCSSHHQPRCSHYASTSSVLIKMNHIISCFACCLHKHRAQVHCPGPICCMVVVWGGFFLTFSFYTKALPLTYFTLFFLEHEELFTWLWLKEGTRASETRFSYDEWCRERMTTTSTWQMYVRRDGQCSLKGVAARTDRSHRAAIRGIFIKSYFEIPNRCLSHTYYDLARILLSITRNHTHTGQLSTWWLVSIANFPVVNMRKKCITPNLLLCSPTFYSFTL